MNPLAARLLEWVAHTGGPVGAAPDTGCVGYVLVPDLWARFCTDRAYQDRVLGHLAPRARTLRDLWRRVLPYLADPVWG